MSPRKMLEERDLLAAFKDIAKTHKVTIEELFSGSRLRHVVRARADAMRMLRGAGWSASAVGRFFKRHHTTVLDATRGT